MLDEHCFNKIVIAPTVVPKNQNFVGIGEVLLFGYFNNSFYPGERPQILYPCRIPTALSEGKENVGRVQF